MLAIETSEDVAELLARKFPESIAQKNKDGLDAVCPPFYNTHKRRSDPSGTVYASRPRWQRRSSPDPSITFPFPEPPIR